MQKVVKKKSVYLSDEQKLDVADWLIANKAVRFIQDDNKLIWEFTWVQSKIVKQLDSEGIKCSATHIKKCMELHMLFRERSGNMKVVEVENEELNKLKEELIIKNTACEQWKFAALRCQKVMCEIEEAFARGAKVPVK